ncbi:MAG: hydrogenase 4 subunit F [Acidobacteriota bacterium]
MIELLLAIPLVVALLALLPHTRQTLSALCLLAAVAMLAISLLCASKVMAAKSLSGLSGILMLDSLGLLMALIITLIAFVASIYSVGYLGIELDEKEFSLAALRRYYAIVHLFIFTMLLVVTTANLGVLWVGMEATTLTSALLVVFYNKETSLEAGWKYLILCTVGIAFALLGTIFMYLAAFKSFGEVAGVLNWNFLTLNATSLNPKLVKLAFIFVLIGYGTKAGFVPMHTWLPDAHSQSPTPISAMLSGVMLNCAVYAILRYFVITQDTIGNGYAAQLMLIFGIASLTLATPFILLQKNFKRLLAYSSIEHIGIIAIGIGFGGTLGLYGALLHTLNHALTKSLMFFSVGNILLKYKTTLFERVQQGLIHTMPLTAGLLIVGTLAIIGMPPFGLFISEFTILAAGITKGSYLAAAVYLTVLALVGAGFVYHMFKMVLGQIPERIDRGETSKWNLAAMVILAGCILTLGLYLPSELNILITEAAKIIANKG